MTSRQKIRFSCFTLEGLNSFATVLYFNYLYFFMRDRFGFDNKHNLALAAFLGFELIRKVSPLLHTPLMSLTNAIASISVVGAILIAGEKDASTLSRVLGFVAVVSATTNLVSGYLITDRMLKMFKKREPAKK